MIRFGITTGFLAVLSLAALLRPAVAEPVSQYTKIDLSKCTIVEPASSEGVFGGSWSCQGYRGIPVFVAEGDLRMFVSFGENAARESAASQTLGGFNTINDTLEWRIRNDRPFATILRWSMDTPDGTGKVQVLVVTQLKAGSVCHVAYVNATANPNANILARQAADELAGAHMCERGARVIGKAGRLG
ncbi:hypothetical protein GCM10011316_07830 [Roseibium aquae]|uniref:Uncharacterized protein n=1 Tax=Roseibium aquae TaxID=1323746 RepID=A0A916TAP1_9HYPH|nr:hypothetical protein [Roseibium aquae]GGB38215.1 hypothetical protein GCM10011316_07830 [Roseibium aquae]